MLKKYWLFILFLLPSIGFSQAFIINSQNRLTVGNEKFQWTFSTDSCRLTPLNYLNKISNNTYDLTGPLFSLSLSFPGEGITPPQNVPQQLTSKDFMIDKIEISQFQQTKQAEVQLSGQGLKLIYTISVKNNSPISRINLKIRDNAQTHPFLENTSVLKLHFGGMHAALGGFGQPIFAQDMFMGVEFPAAYSQITRDNQINCWHYVAQTIPQATYYQTHSVIVGATRRNKVHEAFLKYIKSIRPRPDKPFVLYNTWYDIRNFNYQNLLQTIQNFKTILINRYKLKLDAFVIDDGWDNKQSIWEVDKLKFPKGFSPIVNELEKMHSALGLWISPWNGYDQARDERIHWAEEHGYKPSAGRHLCLGDTAYFKRFKQKVLQYQKENNLSFYKIDGFLSVCNELGHNHLPGIYSRELLTRRLIEILKALRAQNPDIFIDITVGTWLSPWWLQWADAVWMTGADYGHADDVPAFSERDKAITFRDYTLYKDFVQHRYQFPLANVMTHGIIKGKFNLLGGKNETLQNWTDNAVMYFSRGVMLWELYLSPELVSKKEWDILAQTMKWAYAHQKILSQVNFIGGNPYQRQIYGYVHRGKNQTLLILRNPFIRPQSITLTERTLLGNNRAGAFIIDQQYPIRKRLSQTLTQQHPLQITLQGYEVKVLKLISKDYACPLPTGVSLFPVKISKNKATFKVYAENTNSKGESLFPIKHLKKLYFNQKKITPKEWTNLLSQYQDQNAPLKAHHYALHLNDLRANKIAGQLIPYGKNSLINGHLAILIDLKEPLDSLSVSLKYGKRTITPQIKKSANGIWYWILFPPDSAEPPIDFQISASKDFPFGQLSIWQLGRQSLPYFGQITLETKGVSFDTSVSLPAHAASKRVTRCLFNMVIGKGR